MPDPDLMPLLRDRWSPRVFDAHHVLGGPDLQLLLEAARWAPSSGNTQPWSFLVGLREDRTHGEICRHLSRGNSGWVPLASAVLISVRQVAEAPGEEPAKFLSYSAYDVGQAAAHLTVQASALGLHVHQFAGFDHDAVAGAFAVPSHWRVTTGIAIGRLGDPDDPAAAGVEERKPSHRKPLTDFVFAERWGAPRAP